MIAYVLLVVFLAVFLVLQTYWKTKGAIVFLLICAGNVLSSSVSGQVATSVSNLLQIQTFPLAQLVKSVLLLGPGILGIIISKGSGKKKHTILYLFLNICSAVLAYLWFIRTLAFDQFSAIESVDVTKKLLLARDYLIGAGVMLAILFLLLDKKKKELKHKSKKG